MWASAVRRAAVEPPMAAIAAVTVVPMLWPITSAAAWFISTAPEWTAASVVAIAALDDCITTVITAPTPTSSRRPPRLSPGNAAGSIRVDSACIPACKVSIPTKMRPNPARASPPEASLPRPSRRSSAPTATRGRATVPRLSFSPTSDTIHPVLVVPRFAPMITPTACGKVSSPALTKPIVVSTVALELCSTAVAAVPDAIARNGPPVKRTSVRRSASPASAFSPSVSRIIPRRKRPIPPMIRLNMLARVGRVDLF
jgi:hypothetical protein